MTHFVLLYFVNIFLLKGTGSLNRCSESAFGRTQYRYPLLGIKVKVEDNDKDEVRVPDLDPLV